MKYQREVCQNTSLIQVKTRKSSFQYFKEIHFLLCVVSTFQTEYLISGIAPLESNQLVLLGYPKEKDSETGKACRPIVCVVEYKSCECIELSRDCLSLCGYSELKCNDYHLDCLIEENQYFIVSPKDIVVATLCENDDRIAWLIEHR